MALLSLARCWVRWSRWAHKRNLLRHKFEMALDRFTQLSIARTWSVWQQKVASRRVWRLKARIFVSRRHYRNLKWGFRKIAKNLQLSRDGAPRTVIDHVETIFARNIAQSVRANEAASASIRSTAIALISRQHRRITLARFFSAWNKLAKSGTTMTSPRYAPSTPDLLFATWNQNTLNLNRKT